MIRWVFWDLGDTLVNEDRLRCAIWQDLQNTLRAAGSERSFGELLRLREHLAAAGDTSPHYTLARRGLTDEQFEAWLSRTSEFVSGTGQTLINPVPGSQEALIALSGRVSNGIIADQPVAVLDTLTRLGMRGLFQFEGLNCFAGRSKPDPEFFLWALQHADCAPGDAVMVGNRFDQDAEPALGVGMHAILCYLSPWEKGWTPTTDAENTYLSSLARVPNWAMPESTAGAKVCANMSEVLRHLNAME